MSLMDCNYIAHHLKGASTQGSADADAGEPIGLRDKRGTTKEGQSEIRLIKVRDGLGYGAAGAVGDVPAVGECLSVHAMLTISTDCSDWLTAECVARGHLGQDAFALSRSIVQFRPTSAIPSEEEKEHTRLHTCVATHADLPTDGKTDDAISRRERICCKHGSGARY
jgi:hypothetical protein